MGKRWKSDISDWNNVSNETANLFIDLAEKRLDETISTASHLSDKNDKLLTLSITLITPILGYLIDAFFKNKRNEFLICSLIIMVIIITCSLYFLVKNLMFNKLGTKGEEPKFIMTEEFRLNNNNDEHFLNLAFHIAEIYQMKIDNNTKINALRQRRLEISIYILLCIPSSFLLAWAYLWVLAELKP